MIRTILLIFLTLLFFKFSTAQNFNNQLFFKRYGMQEGLSEATINSIKKDNHGYLWIGTNNGLDRFDGYSFKHYGNNPLDSASLSNNIVHDIEINGDDIWIATSSGLTKYDLITDSFKQIHSPANNTNVFRNIHLDLKRNRLWTSKLQSGLFYLDLTTEKLHKYEVQELRQKQIYDINTYLDKHLIITTLNAGFYMLDLTTKELAQYNKSASGLKQTPENITRGLIVCDSTIWIGFQSSGLLELNPFSNKNHLYTTSNSGLHSNQIYYLTHDDNRNLWIGTDGGGLSILDNADQKISSYQNIEGDPNSLSANVVRVIYCASNQNVFLGTYKGGLNIFNERSRQFTNIKRNFNTKSTLSARSIKAFEEDDKGIWIGSDGGGLDFLSYEGQLKNISQLNDQLPSKKILCLEWDSDEGLWIGTYNKGLFKYKNGQLKSFLNDPKYSQLKGVSIWDIKKDLDGNLWVGTNLGLFLYDPVKDSFTSIQWSNGDILDFQRNELRVIEIDPTGNLWVGTVGGVVKYNHKNGKASFFDDSKKVNGLNNNLVISLEVDENYVYAGTFGGGLNIIDKKNGSTMFLTAADNQIPSNIVFSILNDQHSRLWISSNKGLSIIDKNTWKCIQTYNKFDGLQGNIFNKNASFISKKGLLFFGGVNGFNVVDPNNITLKTLNSQPSFTDFQIYNKSAPVGDNQVIKKSIHYTNEISLPYSESHFFGFEFSGLEYIYQDQLSYAYKLEGFDQDWNYIGNQRKINFTNLDPKRYTLRIKCSFDGVDWTSEESKITINIIPSWWMTWYFKLGVVVAIGVISVSMYLLRIQNLKKDREKLKAEVETKTKEIQYQNDQLSKMHVELKSANSGLEKQVITRTKKLNDTIEHLNKVIVELDRFVYSASHDLSAPLKSILGLINLARTEELSNNTELHLKHIEESIVKLEKVILSLAQYARNSQKEIIIEQINIKQLVVQNFQEAQKVYPNSQASLNVSTTGDPMVASDRQRLNMILHNLFINAIKFSNHQNEITTIIVSIDTQKNEWVLSVKDNGIGISRKHLDHVYGMFYRAHENATGSGLGLYIVKETLDKLGATIKTISSKGKGSEFLMTFPKI